MLVLVAFFVIGPHLAYADDKTGFGISGGIGATSRPFYK
jgi:hypothetical protein